MTRCAIYARYSTDLQSQTSAEDQARDCRARADRDGWEVVQVYSDLAMSGASDRRPGLQAMLADAAAGAFEVVLAEALDRISRNQADIAAIYQRLEFAGVRIETLSEGRINEITLGFKGVMGALFLKDLGEKIKRGARGALARGRIPGGLAYGYEVVREFDEHGRAVAGKRRVVPEQAEVVRRVLREYVDGRSPRAIAIDLNRDGIPSPRGGEWRASAIVGNRARQIGLLNNPIYVGRYVWNRVTMKRDPDSRKRVSRAVPAAERQAIELPELRIVDDELWQAVQDARTARAAQPLFARKRPRHFFSGLIRCGLCDGGIAVFANDRMTCTRAREAGTCTNREAVRVGDLQRRVLAGLREQLLAPEAVSLLVQEYHAERDRRATAVKRGRDAARRRLGELDAAVTRLCDAVADGGADFADLRDALGRKIADRDRVRAEVAEEKAYPVLALRPRLADAYRAKVAAITDDIAEGRLPPDALRELIRSLVEVIHVWPAEHGGHELHVVGSLEAALALAENRKPPRRGMSVSVPAVAEESYRRSRQRRSIKT